MNRLRELRIKSGKSQKDVANFISKTFQAYSLYEQGKREPDNETLSKLADYFSVTIDYLLGRNIIPETKTDLSTDENQKAAEIYEIYDKLSDEAREKLFEYADDLLGNPKNRK